MGSFNENCVVSGSTITDGDKVRLFFIVSDPFMSHQHASIFCGDNIYPWSNFTLASFGVQATYKDYGKYEVDSELPEVRFLIDRLKDLYWTISSSENNGKNKFSFCDIYPENLTWEKILDILNANEFFCRYAPWNNTSRSFVKKMAIHESVFQMMISKKYNLVQRTNELDFKEVNEIILNFLKEKHCSSFDNSDDQVFQMNLNYSEDFFEEHYYSTSKGKIYSNWINFDKKNMEYPFEYKINVLTENLILKLYFDKNYLKFIPSSYQNIDACLCDSIKHHMDILHSLAEIEMKKRNENFYDDIKTNIVLEYKEEITYQELMNELNNFEDNSDISYFKNYIDKCLSMSDICIIDFKRQDFGDIKYMFSSVDIIYIKK